MAEFDFESEAEPRQSFWIKNSEDIPIVLCLEPWGNELPISKGNDYLIVFQGPDHRYPAIEWSKKRITVYGWSGSVVSVFLNGKLTLSCATRVPEMPNNPESGQ